MTNTNHGIVSKQQPILSISRNINTFQSSKQTQQSMTSWRLKERVKTVSGGLVVCLNIGVDPPDMCRPIPGAKLQCWIDPFAAPSQKSLEAIGKNLTQQYEFWQPKARFKTALDPTVDDIKKLCIGLRKGSKEERILFHYQGHGVPKPTPNGELWLFNAQFTQYIPMSILEVQSLLQGPAIYVLDCPNAGNLLNILVQRWITSIQTQALYTHRPSPTKDILILGSCGADQPLNTHPDMPADIFTSCLTTPIEMAIRWYITHQNSPLKRIELDTALKIPGRLNDRKSPLGELNWILTAITDTIAWRSFPRDIFQKLYRQDILVAGLFRNYLLAERIIRSIGDQYKSTPICYPPLPSTWKHPMWEAWDFVLETCLNQIPDILESGLEHYRPSSFFLDQLKAFEVWLRHQHKILGKYDDELHQTIVDKKQSDDILHPEQLANLLQVLLSPLHRIRSLELLSIFFDLGSWALEEALQVGVFAYLLKLLQSPAEELCPILSYLWARLLVHDPSTQCDLVKEDSYLYFLDIYLERIMKDNLIYEDDKNDIDRLSNVADQDENVIQTASTEALLPSSSYLDLPSHMRLEKHSGYHEKDSTQECNVVLQRLFQDMILINASMILVLFIIDYPVGANLLLKENETKLVSAILPIISTRNDTCIDKDHDMEQLILWNLVLFAHMLPKISKSVLPNTLQTILQIINNLVDTSYSNSVYIRSACIYLLGQYAWTMITLSMTKMAANATEPVPVQSLWNEKEQLQLCEILDHIFNLESSSMIKFELVGTIFCFKRICISKDSASMLDSLTQKLIDDSDSSVASLAKILLPDSVNRTSSMIKSSLIVVLKHHYLQYCSMKRQEIGIESIIL